MCCSPPALALRSEPRRSSGPSIAFMSQGAAAGNWAVAPFASVALPGDVRLTTSTTARHSYGKIVFGVRPFSLYAAHHSLYSKKTFFTAQALALLGFNIKGGTHRNWL